MRGKRRCESPTVVTFTQPSYKHRERRRQDNRTQLLVMAILSLCCGSCFFSCFCFFFVAHLAVRCNQEVAAASTCRGVDPTRLAVVVPNHTLLALPQASWDLVSQFSASSLTLICNISCAPFIINVPPLCGML